MKTNMRMLVLMVVSLISLSCFTLAQDADPTPPTTLNDLGHSRFNVTQFGSQSELAMAGNISELEIFGQSPTEAWHGFFGNITGTITLEDSNGFALYNWTSAEPQGRIYSSNSSVINWSGIKCFNYTAPGTATGTNFEINVTTIETQFGIADGDEDGLNETFGDGTLPTVGTAYSVDGGSNHPGFVVGTVSITAGTCPATTTHEVGGLRGEHFIETVLTDKESIVFATIIENRTVDQDIDINGFDGNPHDFQMIVLEDGHSGDTTPTSWFFFVELE